MANEQTTPTKQVKVNAASNTPAAATTRNAGEEIDAWAHDLLGNIPDLRETSNYNTFRAALADLKTRIQ